MPYKVYYHLEGDPGIGHSLGPQVYTNAEDTLAEVYDLIRVEEVISVTILTGKKLSRPRVMLPAISTKSFKEPTHRGDYRPRQQPKVPGRLA